MENNQEINVEEIMGQIRSSVKERELHGEKIFFDVVEQSDFAGRVSGEAAADIGDLGGSLGLIKGTAELDTEWTIKSHRKILGFFIVSFKRVIRKLMGEYVRVMAKRQSTFNKGVAHSMYLMYEYIRGQADISDKVDHLEKEVSSSLYKEMVILEERNKGLEAENKKLQQQFSDLEQRYEKANRELQIMGQRIELLSVKCEKLEERQ